MFSKGAPHVYNKTVPTYNEPMNRQPFQKYRLALISVFTAALLGGQASTAAAPPAGGDYAQGTRLYQKGDYAQALPLFCQVVKSQPANVSALLYCGNCYFNLGHASEASSCYQYILKHFPASPEAKSAQQVLARLPAAAGASAASAATPASASTLASAPAAKQKLSKEEIIDKMTYTVRAQAGRPEVSDLIVAQTKRALSEYPTNLLAFLYKRGCRICLTPTLIDKDPELVNTHPKGYEEGQTYRNCPACFQWPSSPGAHGEVTVCEYSFIGDGPDLRHNPDNLPALRHELGHALDYYLGGVSRTDEYRHQYYLDLGQMDDDTRARLAYYTQKDRTGPSESMAELLGYKFGNQDDERATSVHNNFKLTARYLDDLFAKM